MSAGSGFRSARTALLAGAAAAALAGAWALDGSASLGRLAMRLGAPSLALLVADDDFARGVALYRLERYDESAEAFRRSLKNSSYNHGNAQMFSGYYAGAVSAYRAVLARDPEDWEARDNLAIAELLYEALIGDPLPGDDAAGDGSAAAGSAPNDEVIEGGGDREPTESAKLADDLQSEQFEAVQEVVRRKYLDRGVVADERWLASLADAPGRYLKARIAAEHDWRVEQGLAPPPMEEP